MINVYGNRPNSVIAKVTVTFADAGLTADNIAIIYLIDAENNQLKSWVPGRDINGIDGFTSGKGYYLIPKVDIDLTAYLSPPLPSNIGQVGTPANFTATAGNGEVLLDWDAVTSADYYILERATNAGFTTGLTLLFIGTNTQFDDNTVSNGTTYYYRVKAFGSGFYFSNYASASATPSAPAATMLHGGHMMLAFMPLDPNSWMASLKNDLGHNYIELFGDIYDATYTSRRSTMSAAAASVGVPSLGQINVKGVVTRAMIFNMAKDSLQDANCLKINNKPVFCLYLPAPTEYNNLVADLTAAGIARNTYLLIANPFYAFWNGSSWQENYSDIPTSKASVQHALDMGIDGIMPFSVDRGTTDDTFVTKIMEENQWVWECCNTSGKIAFAGIAANYHNKDVQQTSNSFAGLDTIMNAIIALPQNQRPIGIAWATLTDHLEQSSVGPTPNGATNGLGYLPNPGAGYNLGGPANTDPTLDRTGAVKFILPHIAALNANTALSITTEKIFAWYSLHPREVSVSSTIQAPYSSYPSQYPQGWWDTTPFAVVPAWVAAGKYPKFNVIRMAAHLSSPAKLKINGTLSSTTFSAGIAVFEIPIAFGTPTFAINRAGVDVLIATGQQAIVNNPVPGGFKQLIMEQVTGVGGGGGGSDIVLQDDFSSILADIAGTNPSPTSVSAWTALYHDGALATDGSKVLHTGSGSDLYFTASTNLDCELEVKLAAVGSGGFVQLIFKKTGGNIGYLDLYSGGFIGQNLSGVDTHLAAHGITSYAANDVITIQIVGQVITVNQNGVQKSTATLDSSLTGNGVGFFYYQNTAIKFDYIKVTKIFL